jgi:parallel beta-helix repeat protein
MRRSHVRICLTAALTVLGSLAFSGVAAAGHGGNVHCGDVITADTTLTGDVGPCGAASGTNGALTITASGTSTDYVTVDLNGHTVYGCDNANPMGPCNSLNVNDPSLKEPFVTGEGPGIVIDRQDYVKITDSSNTPTASGTGTVRDFDTGIVIRGGSHNVIEAVDVKRNVGTAVTDSDYGEGIGIYAYLKEDSSSTTGRKAPGALANWEHSTNNTVRANVVEGNGPYAGIALYSFDDTFPGPVAPVEDDTSTPPVKRGATDSNTIGGTTAADGNTVKDNYVTPNGFSYQDDGIRLEPKVTNNTVQHNTVTGSSLEGIAVFADAVQNKVLNNTVSGNGNQPLLTQRKGDGIRVFLRAERTLVQENTVCGNYGSGISVDSTTTYPSATQRSTIQDNTAGVTEAVPCAANGVGPDLPTRTRYDLFEGGHTLATESCRHIWSGNTAITAFPTCTDTD